MGPWHERDSHEKLCYMLHIYRIWYLLHETLPHAIYAIYETLQHAIYAIYETLLNAMYVIYETVLHAIHYTGI